MRRILAGDRPRAGVVIHADTCKALERIKIAQIFS